MNYDKRFCYIFRLTYYGMLFYVIASIFVLLTGAFQDDQIKFNGKSNLI